MRNKQIDFRFYTDELSIIKAKDDSGNKVMKIGGIASREERDQQGEILVVEGMDVQDMVWGFLNWNHWGSKDPSTVIGQITKVEKRHKELYIEAELFEESKMARDVYQLTEILEKRNSPRKMQFSVEGKSIERDILDQGRVTKSKIVGCACTVSPINKATFAQIIKGEVPFENSLEEPLYQEPEPDVEKSANGGEETLILDVIDESGCRMTVDKDYKITIDKSMSTQSASALIPESLDGNVKKLTKSFFIDEKIDNFNENLEKSQIYDYFLNEIPDISSENLNRLYKAVNAFNKVVNKMPDNTITQEGLEKAFAVLMDLSKAESMGSVPVQDAKTEGGATSAIEVMKACIEKGMSKEDMFKAVKESNPDMSDDDMEEAYQKNFAKKDDMKKSEETNQESIDDQILKAEADLEALRAKKEEDIKKSEPTEPVAEPKQEVSVDTESLIKGLTDTFNSKFEAMGEILKSVVGANDLLKSENEDLKTQKEAKEEELKKSQEAYNKLANEPSQPKTITTQSYIQKGEQPNPQGNRRMQLSQSQHRDQIIQKGNLMYDQDINAQPTEEEAKLIKSLVDYEFEGKVDFTMKKAFADQGIDLVD